jgi:hypothetical protein
MLLKGQVKFFPLAVFNFSVWIIILVILLSVGSLYAGWISRNIYEVFFSAGLFIFITIFICFGSLSNLFPQILSAAYPLFIVAIRDFRNQKFTGKVTDD